MHAHIQVHVHIRIYRYIYTYLYENIYVNRYRYTDIYMHIQIQVVTPPLHSPPARTAFRLVWFCSSAFVLREAPA